MNENKDIPTIYASIGNREDVNTNPTIADAVASVLTSPAALDYREKFVNDEFWKPNEADTYIGALEHALIEALSPDFLAAKLEELAESEMAFQTAYTGMSYVDPEHVRHFLREIHTKQVFQGALRALAKKMKKSL